VRKAGRLKKKKPVLDSTGDRERGEKKEKSSQRNFSGLGGKKLGGKTGKGGKSKREKKLHAGCREKKKEGGGRHYTHRIHHCYPHGETWVANRKNTERGRGFSFLISIVERKKKEGRNEAYFPHSFRLVERKPSRCRGKKGKRQGQSLSHG